MDLTLLPLSIKVFEFDFEFCVCVCERDNVKCYPCLSLFDENRKETNAENKTSKRQTRKDKSVFVCEGVVCEEYNAYLCKHMSLSCKPRSAHECR